MSPARRLTFVTVAVGLAAIIGGSAYAWTGHRAETSPQAVVAGYFSALSRGDAATALAYGGLPAGSRRWLTHAVLADQLHRARIDAVNVTGGIVSHETARVGYRYRLSGGAGSSDIRGTALLHHDADGWRMSRVAEPVQVRVRRAAGIAELGGARLPGGAVLLFPGALPVAFSGGWLEPDRNTADVRLGAGTEQLAVSPGIAAAGRHAVTRGLQQAVTACFTGSATSVSGGCPRLPGRIVPGTVRGSALPPGSSQLSVRLGRAGVLQLAGTVTVVGHWRQLDFQNVPRPVSGRLSLRIAARASPAPPLQLRLLDVR